VTNSVKSEAYTLVFWQLCVVVGLALILFLLKGLQSGCSSLLGGLAYCVPNFLFVWRVFSRTSAQAASSFLVSFFAGEVSKLFLSGILFVLIVKYLTVDFKFVLAGYIAAIVAFWLVSFIFLAQEHPGEKS
jgi:ATP synthase protein I